MKKKVKKKILALLAGLLPPLLVVLLLASGLIAVVSLTLSIAEHIFSPTISVNDALDKDYSDYTLDEMIKVVDDPQILTEEDLDNMMIERSTLKHLLEKVKEVNTVYDTDEKKLGAIHEWTETVTTTYTDKNGKTHTITRKVKHKDKDVSYINLSVTAADYEGAYKIDWQPLYCIAVFDTLKNYSISTADGEDSGAGVDSGGLRDDLASLEELSGTYNPRTQWDDSFEEAAELTGLPVGLLKAVAFRESSFQPNIISSAGAVGLMQLMPSTAGLTVEELKDPDTNIRKGAMYLAGKIKQKGGNVILGLTAYNRGPNAKCFKTNHFTAAELEYAARVLSTFTGRALTGRSLINCDDDDFYLDLGSYGTYDEDTGRVSLTDGQIDMLIEDFSPHFLYDYDFVRDDQTVFKYDECESMVNTGLKTKGDPNTEEGAYYWYEPISVLTEVNLPYADIYYENNVPVEYVLNRNRWICLMDFYCYAYDGEWLQMLIESLPRGEDAVNNYLYIANKCTRVIEYGDDTSTSTGGGGNIGYYVPTDPYTDTPLNADGKTRDWSLTQEDLNLINLSDAQMWEKLTGYAQVRPSMGKRQIESHMTKVVVPIWVWKYPKTDKLDKVSTTMTLTVNRTLANSVRHIFADIYNDPSKPVFNKSVCGGYCYRNISGTSKLSMHSYGVAIDLNWNTTVGKWTHWQKNYNTVPTKSQWEKLPESQAKYELFYRDCPVVCIFKAYGWYWGADYSSNLDGMHFSKCGDYSQEAGKANHEVYYK